MSVKKISMTQEEALARQKTTAHQHFYSRYNFLNQHKGLRPNKFHLFLGVPGGGKSTLRNSLIYDFVEKNPGKRVFLYLSEESVEDFMNDLCYNVGIVKHLDNLYCYSEQEERESFDDKEKAFDRLKETMIRSECHLFIFDNITTSKLYGSSPWEQEKFTNNAKQFIQKLGCTSVIFAHTKAEIDKHYAKMIGLNDIRGSKNLVNLTEFQYILQTFECKKTVVTTLRTEKHRGWNVGEKMFLFEFDEYKKVYANDHVSDIAQFNEIFNRRNQLGAKPAKNKKYS